MFLFARYSTVDGNGDPSIYLMDGHFPPASMKSSSIMTACQIPITVLVDVTDTLQRNFGLLNCQPRGEESAWSVCMTASLWLPKCTSGEVKEISPTRTMLLLDLLKV
jgi:hypothetical protein